MAIFDPYKFHPTFTLPGASQRIASAIKCQLRGFFWCAYTPFCKTKSGWKPPFAYINRRRNMRNTNHRVFSITSFTWIMTVAAGHEENK